MWGWISHIICDIKVRRTSHTTQFDLGISNCNNYVYYIRSCSWPQPVIQSHSFKTWTGSQEWSVESRVWKGGGVLIRHSRPFFISFPNTTFLSQKNALKSPISSKASKINARCRLILFDWHFEFTRVSKGFSKRNSFLYLSMNRAGITICHI